MSARRITIRPADESDLDALTTLFRLRDARSYDRSVVNATIFELDPARCAALIAFDGDRPVGMTTYYPRTLWYRGSAHRVGYWQHLFVDPEYRRAMVYPRLPLLMFKAAEAEGLEFVLTVTREKESVGVHLQIGCVDLGLMDLRVKPLRPFRAVAKQRQWGSVARAAALGDVPFGVVSRAYTWASTPRVEICDLASDSAEMADLLSARRALAEDYVHQAWTPAMVADRFAHHLEGERYFLIGARRRGRIAAAGVFRLGERFGIRGGIVMDLYWHEGEEDAVRAVLAAAERRARAAGADVMLHLDGLRGGISAELARSGYVRASERYRVIVWPKTWTPSDAAMLDVPRWWFSFADHDTF